MINNFFLPFFLFAFINSKAQLNPAITSFLQNNLVTGTYYMSGNSTLQPNNVLVNCQKVEYATNSVYVHTKGVPAYPTGSFFGW